MWNQGYNKGKGKRQSREKRKWESQKREKGRNQEGGGRGKENTVLLIISTVSTTLKRFCQEIKRLPT